MSIGPIRNFLSAARSERTPQSERVTNPQGQGLTSHLLDNGDVFERHVGADVNGDTASYFSSLESFERDRELRAEMMRTCPGFVTYTGTDPYLQDVQNGVNAVEESSRDADFIVNCGRYGNKEWGKKNDDGTYTIYGQEYKGGSQPYEVETITEEEAKAKGYIS